MLHAPGFGLCDQRGVHEHLKKDKSSPQRDALIICFKTNTLLIYSALAALQDEEKEYSRVAPNATEESAFERLHFVNCCKLRVEF